MKLAQWLEAPNPDGSRKSKAKFAHDIGVTPQMISAYCTKTIPSKAVAEAIVKQTGGAVTPNDFIDIESILSEVDQ